MDTELKWAVVVVVIALSTILAFGLIAVSN
ncbi:YnhF family membrane protein [Thaumasiovibrio sp. DFM-14]